MRDDCAVYKDIINIVVLIESLYCKFLTYICLYIHTYTHTHVCIHVYMHINNVRSVYINRSKDG